MKSIDVIAAILVVVGALNWGLVGLFQFDLVASTFGSGSNLPARFWAGKAISAGIRRAAVE